MDVTGFASMLAVEKRLLASAVCKQLEGLMSRRITLKELEVILKTDLNVENVHHFTDHNFVTLRRRRSANP